jgi:hypothetical protein
VLTVGPLTADAGMPLSYIGKLGGKPRTPFFLLPQLLPGTEIKILKIRL